jgi:hypothetical protein
MFRFPTCASVGDVLYPWWLWTMAQRTSHRRMCVAHPSVGNIKTNRIAPQSPHAIPSLRVGCAQYRGFRRTFRCLTIDTVVARLVENGPRPVLFRLLCL